MRDITLAEDLKTVLTSEGGRQTADGYAHSNPGVEAQLVLETWKLAISKLTPDDKTPVATFSLCVTKM